MTYRLSDGRIGAAPISESVWATGPILRYATALLAGATYNSSSLVNGGWIDVSCYGVIRLQTTSDQDSAAGGIIIDWSLGATGGTAYAPAGSVIGSSAAGVYDSGNIPVAAQWLRVRYTNGAVNQANFTLVLSAMVGSVQQGVEMVNSSGADIGTGMKADLDATANYTPGMYGVGLVSAALVANIPQALVVIGAGQVYALSVAALAGAEARCRVVYSRPISIAGAGLTGCTFTNGSATVTLNGTVASNVAIGQFVYLATDGSASRALVTNVVAGGGNTTITLSAVYTGAGGTGAAVVAGFATAGYATVPEQSSALLQGLPYGGGTAQANDLIIVCAEAGSTGIGTTVCAVRVF